MSENLTNTYKPREILLTIFELMTILYKAAPADEVLPMNIKNIKK